MIYEEALTDRGPWVNVDAGKAVGVLAHDSRHQRNTLSVKLVGNAVDHHCQETGIAEDYLIVVFGCRITLKSCPYILRQKYPDFGKLFHESYRFLTAAFLAVCAR